MIVQSIRTRAASGIKPASFAAPHDPTTEGASSRCHASCVPCIAPIQCKRRTEPSPLACPQFTSQVSAASSSVCRYGIGSRSRTKGHSAAGSLSLQRLAPSHRDFALLSTRPVPELRIRAAAAWYPSAPLYIPTDYPSKPSYLTVLRGCGSADLFPGRQTRCGRWCVRSGAIEISNPGPNLQLAASNCHSAPWPACVLRMPADFGLHRGAWARTFGRPCACMAFSPRVLQFRASTCGSRAVQAGSDPSSAFDVAAGCGLRVEMA